ncbi:MAG: tetratricopeptide repeat protein [Gallionella sp.]|nr:tetratricopeptide repeat protein [Gallionella sp.]
MLCLLVGCGHTPEMRSPRLLQAIEFNQQGEKEFRRGEFQSAIDNFQASLQINESIEHLNGIAINLINLAKACQSLNDFTAAHHFVDILLQEKVLRFSDEYLAAAATQKSLLFLRQNEVEESARWIDNAVKWCVKCSMVGVIFNVRSNIALRMNDGVQAAYWGELGLRENKRRSSVEYANSLRLLARAKLLNNLASGALPLLEEALALDKQSGDPDKIAYDMNVMADVYASLGEQDKAQEYRARGMRVTERFLGLE